MSNRRDVDRFYIPARWDFKNATNRELYQFRAACPCSTVLLEIVIEMEMRKMLTSKRIVGAGYPEALNPDRRGSVHHPDWNRIENALYRGGVTRAEAMKSLGILEEE